MATYDVDDDVDVDDDDDDDDDHDDDDDDDHDDDDHDDDDHDDHDDNDDDDDDDHDDHDDHDDKVVFTSPIFLGCQLWAHLHLIANARLTYQQRPPGSNATGGMIIDSSATCLLYLETHSGDCKDDS